MTEKLYDKDAYLKEFSAVVLSCGKAENGFCIVLDKTAFFPEAGGQPSDKGFIDYARVVDVQINDGIIRHYTDHPLKAGETVTGRIDFERRYDFMQQHSGEHTVSGVAHKMFGCENVGFHLSEEVVTLDFDMLLNDEQIKKLEENANKAVFGCKSIKAYYPDTETLKDLKYRSKKELSGDIRIVEIEDTDACACCAPHVKNTGEVGIIKFISKEKMRGGTRLFIKCGSRAVKQYDFLLRQITAMSNLFCVKPEEVWQSVYDMHSKNAELAYKIKEEKLARFELLANDIKSFPKCTAHFESDLEIKELSKFADCLYKNGGGIRGAFSTSGENILFSICADENELKTFFESFKAKFNVKGGGRNSMVSGSVAATKDEIAEFFENYL